MVINAPLMLVIIGILLILSSVINRKKNALDVKYFTEMADKNRIYGHILWEMEDFRYGKDIRLYGACGMMLEKASQQIKKLNDYEQENSDRKFPLNILDMLVNVLRDFGTYLYLGSIAIAGRITIGVFSQLLTAGGVLHSSLQAMIFGFQDIEKRSSYAYETVKFMEYPPYMEKGERKIENLDGGHTIEFRNVGFSYPGTGVKVLDNVSIILHSGEKLSVVGLNGAGKTTFVKLMLRLYDVTEGQILLNGTDIREFDRTEYFSLFAPAFQDVMVFAFPMCENVSMKEPFNTDKEKAEKMLRKAGLGEKIDSLEKGVETELLKVLYDDGIDLSGGERQKLALGTKGKTSPYYPSRKNSHVNTKFGEKSCTNFLNEAIEQME